VFFETAYEQQILEKHSNYVTQLQKLNEQTNDGDSQHLQNLTTQVKQAKFAYLLSIARKQWEIENFTRPKY